MTAKIDECELKKNPKILLMDDEDIIRENMVELGELLDLDIICARNSRETIELFNNSMSDSDRFSAVILDLTIKGDIGGELVLNELKLIDPTIKAILFSGHAFSPASVRYKEHGFCAVITKPIEVSELKRIIYEVLE